MLLLLIVPCSNLATDDLCGNVAPELAGSTMWGCLYVALLESSVHHPMFGLCFLGILAIVKRMHASDSFHVAIWTHTRENDN